MIEGRGALPPDAAPIFAAPGDPSRLPIVLRLCEPGPLATTDLIAGGAISRQGLTRQLRVLEEAGLVESFRAGRDRHWRLRARAGAGAGARLPDGAAAARDARPARPRSRGEADCA